MKSPFFITLLTSIALGLVAYFIVPMFANTVSPLIYAVTALVSGLVTGIVVLKTNATGQGPGGKRSKHTSNQENITLYVGNLAYRANETMVKEHFSKVGHVESVRLMKDKRTGKRKGFGFVEMTEDAGHRAIEELNDSVFQDRTLKVRLAKEKNYDNS